MTFPSLRSRLLVPGLLVALALGTVAAAPSDPIASVRPVTGSAAASLAPEPHHREVAGIVADMLTRYHYERVRIDDNLSAKWLDQYLDMLDYTRTVLLQSDVDEFQRLYRDRLDDEVLASPPRLDAAVVIYERYRQRMLERADFALKVVEGPIDLANVESYVPDRHEAGLPWPADKAEADLVWRQRIEDEFIAGHLGKETDDAIRDRLRKRYDRYGRSVRETESTDVLEFWLGALGQSFDPHSTWFKPARNDDFDIDITNSVEGIGAQLRTDGDHVTVSELIAGGPAATDGRLRKGDKILAVAQQTGEPTDVVGLRIDKVVKQIRGPKGTVVKLHVLHADAEPGQVSVIDLTRDRVMLENTAAVGELREIGGRKLGVVKLPGFYVDPTGRRGGARASQDVKREIGELAAEGAQGLVLDLRGNGGGSLIEAIDVAGLFLPGGPVVQVRDRDGRIEALHDTDPAVAWSGPLVVLTDPTSASASEIVAGALQDYGRAVVVGGRQTHGKGTVQQVAPLTAQLKGRHDDEIGGALKLTIQKFYRVSGGSTQSRGVEADVVVKTRWDGMDVYESDLPNALVWDRVPPAPHVMLGEPAKAVPELARRSAERVAADEDFGKLSSMLDELAQMRAQHESSLVLEVRQREYEERKARGGFDDPPPPSEDGAEPEEDDEDARDFTLDEALAVLGDWMALG